MSNDTERRPRTYGAGTIYQRTKDGRWIGSVELPRARGERRKRATFSATTRELVEAWLAEYRQAVPAPDRLGRRENLRRARELGTHTRKDYMLLVRSKGGLCEYCGKKIRASEHHGDHDIPLSRGGSDGIDNMVVSCRDCNTEKGTMTGDEYRAWKATR